MKKNKQQDSKVKGVVIEGCTVLESLGCDKFNVRLPNDYEMICHISGKIRKNHIRILPFDMVTIEVSPYDVLHNGRIIYRGK